MIFDTIVNAEKYTCLSDLVGTALAYLKEHDLAGMEEQRIDIQNSDVYVMIQHYDTESAASRFYESHDDYIDIQYMISGTETMVYSNRKLLAIETEYNAESDCTLYHHNRDVISTDLNLGKGDFAIFYPMDAHIPKLQSGGTSRGVKKAVFKVRVSSST